MGLLEPPPSGPDIIPSCFYKCVECSISRSYLKAHEEKFLDQIVPSPLKLYPHNLNGSLVTRQSRQAPVHGKSGRMADRVLLNLRHLPDDLGGSNGPSQPPSGHCIGLGKTVDCDCPLFHIAYCCKRLVLFSVGELFVNFIGESEEIEITAHIGNKGKRSMVKDRT